MEDLTVDYHIHTTFSDGESTPGDIIKKAAGLGYDVIAITDHDNVDGIPEALSAAKEEGLAVIPGIEIAVETDAGIGLHMLGYGLDYKNPLLEDFLAELIRARRIRNVQLIQALNQMGFHISQDEVKEGNNGFVGKPILARILVEKGYIKNENEAFTEKIFGSKECMAVKKVKPLAQDAMNVIRQAGGIPVLAHPIQTLNVGETGSRRFYNNMDSIIGRLKMRGLGGLECFHPDQNKRQSEIFVRMADKYGLFITRGSDFHGADYTKADRTADYKTGRRVKNLCFLAEQGKI